MPTHFAQLFWGLLIVTLDFRIIVFDVLPDGIGYLIIAAGCYGLNATSSRFSSAWILCLLLALLWLTDFVHLGEISIILDLVSRLVNCAMIWQLLGGIAGYAAERKRSDLAQRATNRRLAYVAMMVSFTLLSFTMHGAHSTRPLIIILVVSVLALVIMIFHLIHRVKTEIAMGEIAT